MNDDNPNKQTHIESARQQYNGGRSLGEPVEVREEEEEDGRRSRDLEQEKAKKDEPVTWKSLPKRSQLVILTLARLSEPLVQTSLQVSTSRKNSVARWLLTVCQM